MNIFMVLPLLAIFAFLAMNLGVRQPRPGWGPIALVLAVALVAYLLWPYVAPLLTPITAHLK